MDSSFDMSQLPPWAQTLAETLIADRQITFNELVTELVCSHIRSPHQRIGTEFTVPHQMAPSLIGNDFMVVRHSPDGVVLTPSNPIPFDEALAEYQEKVSPQDPMFEALLVQ